MRRAVRDATTRTGGSSAIGAACMPHDTPHPCLRKNSGYRPRAGTYKRRAPWQHRGRARPGDACAYEQARKLSIDDYMIVQGWDPKYRGVLPAGDSKTARYRAVGLLANSVVPAVVEHAARSIVWRTRTAARSASGGVAQPAEGQAAPTSPVRHSTVFVTTALSFTCQDWALDAGSGGAADCPNGTCNGSYHADTGSERTVVPRLSNGP